MGGLGILTNLNFQLLNKGQTDHVTSGPNVDGNTDRVVTIKCMGTGVPGFSMHCRSKVD